jgi:hypothetical protein
VRTLRGRSLVLLALVVAALSAGVLSACGSSSSTKPADVLEQTFTSAKTVKSGKLDVGVTLQGKGGKSVVLDVAGPFQSNGAGHVPSFDLTAAVTLTGQSLSAGLISTGDHLYVSFRGTDYVVPDATFAEFRKGYVDAQRQNGTSGATSGSALSALGLHPLTWLVDPKNAGTVNVAGTDTIHITTGLNLGALLRDASTVLGKANASGLSAGGQKVPTSITPAQIAKVTKTLTNVHADVFTGKDDKTLRRIVLAGGLHVNTSAGGLTPTGVRVSIAITDLNEPQTITAPSNAKPISELGKELSAMFGGFGALTGGGAAGGSSSGSSSKTAKTAKAYLDCVKRAGRDAAKIQRCSPLLSP